MKNGEKLKDVIQETLTYLDICTEFWNQEEPVTWEKEKIKSKDILFSRRTLSEPAGFLLKSLEDIDEGQWPRLEPMAGFLYRRKFLTVHFSM